MIQSRKTNKRPENEMTQKYRMKKYLNQSKLLTSICADGKNMQLERGKGGVDGKEVGVYNSELNCKM